MNNSAVPSAPFQPTLKRSFGRTGSLSGSPWVEWGAVATILILFVILQLIHPHLPGASANYAHVEEQVMAADLVNYVRDGSFWQRLIEGRLPAGRNEYHGLLMSYLFAPVLALFGRNWMIAKYWYLPFILGSLLFVHQLMRNVYGKKPALLALLCLLIHPSYEMGSRLSATLGYIHFFSIGCLFFLERWWATRKNIYLSLGLFFLGLGMWSALWFYWFWVGLLACLIVFQRDLRTRFAINSGPRLYGLAAWGLAGLGTGLIPVLYRDIFSGFASVQKAIRAGFLSPDNPHQFQNYFASFADILKLLHDYLSGKFLYKTTFPFAWKEGTGLLAAFPSDLIYPWLVAVAVLFLLFRGLTNPADRRFLFLPVFFLAIVAVMPVSHGLDVQAFSVYPLPQLILSVALIEIFRRLRGVKAARLILIGLLSATAFLEARGLHAYYRQLRSTGGARDFSDSIYEMADWMKARVSLETPTFVFSQRGEWFFRHLYFTAPSLDLKPVEIDGAYNPELGVHDPLLLMEHFQRKLKEAGGNALFFCDSEGSTELYKPFPIFKWLRENAVRYRLLKEFKEEDGFVLMRVYGVGPAYAREDRE